MKQYTSKDQTAKLIELGFPKPKPSFYQNGATWIQCEGNYSIGELIEFIKNVAENNSVNIYTQFNLVEFDILKKSGRRCGYSFRGDELIDSLFDACVTLKEEGMI